MSLAGWLGGAPSWVATEPCSARHDGLCLTPNDTAERAMVVRIQESLTYRFVPFDAFG